MASQSQTPFTSVSPTVNMRPIYLKMERYTDEELELLLQIRTSNPKAKWKTVASLYNEKATRPRTVQAITNKAKQLQRKQPKWANAMLRAQGARTGDVAPVSWKGLLQGCITDRPLSNKTSKCSTSPVRVPVHPLEFEARSLAMKASSLAIRAELESRRDRG